MKRLHGESGESATDVDGDIILTPREDCITFSFFFFFFFFIMFRFFFFFFLVSRLPSCFLSLKSLSSLLHCVVNGDVLTAVLEQVASG